MSEYLRTVASDFDQWWRDADKRAERGIASAYDEVRRALVDIYPKPIRFALRELISTESWRNLWPGMENAVPWFGVWLMWGFGRRRSNNGRREWERRRSSTQNIWIS